MNRAARLPEMNDDVSRRAGPLPEFHSILHAAPVSGLPREIRAAPACFADLNLDQVVAAITAGREEYDLAPILHAPLQDQDAVRYRHEVFRDLEDERVLGSVTRFAHAMQEMRERLATAGKLHYTYQKDRLFLDATQIYCDAAEALTRELAAADLRSRGLGALRLWLAGYLASPPVVELRKEMQRLYAALSEVRYCLHVRGDRVRVRKAHDEIDYSAEVEQTFEKFKRAAAKSYLVEYKEFLDMNHIEAAVLEMVAKLYPEVFRSLHAFHTGHADYLDARIAAFDREVQVYLGYIAFMRGFREARLPFCYPEVSSTDKTVLSIDGFDLPLARKLLSEKGKVVCNDFRLDGAERIIVVTGPNQGGKTTFARAFGQLHYLASLGLPVPGREARLFLCDRLFTHFEKEEDVYTEHGKLKDELERMHDILAVATPRSILVINEIFTSTTVQDALFLGREIMRRLIELDLLGVCVTFLDELTSLGPQTVSMVSTVDPGDLARRTFKLERRPADGLAYALAVARRHRVTYRDLKERLP